jgi:hypothetical protein
VSCIVERPALLSTVTLPALVTLRLDHPAVLSWSRLVQPRAQVMTSARSTSDDSTPPCPLQTQLRLSVSRGAQLQSGLIDDRRPVQWTWGALSAGSSGYRALQRTGNGQAMASARTQQSSTPARRALRRQASRSGLGGVSASKAGDPTLMVPRRQRSIVMYMQLQASAGSAAVARAPSARLARGS